MALRTRRDHFGVDTNVDSRRIYPVSRMVSQLTSIPVQPNKAIVGANAFAHSSGIHQDGVLKERTTYEIINPRDVGVPDSEIILSARSGRHGLRHRRLKLGAKRRVLRLQVDHRNRGIAHGLTSSWEKGALSGIDRGLSSAVPIRHSGSP